MRSLQLCSSAKVALGLSLLCGACTDTSKTAAPEVALELGAARQAIVAELPSIFTPKTAAAAAGRSAGVAATVGPLAAEPIYGETITQYFGDVTPENEMKWGNLQPVDANSWSFGNADAIVDFAAANGLRVKGHTLAWHAQLPAFITPALSPGQLNS